MDLDIVRALRAVVDPELGINIVDLGLVYEAEREGDRARVVMTMTTPACPMHSMMTEDAKTAVEMVPGIREADIQLVFEPPWRPERMSEEAKQQLGW